MAKLFITIFLGPFGVHKFMEKKVGLGFLYLFTGGLLGIGWIIDIITATIEFNQNPNRSAVFTPTARMIISICFVLTAFLTLLNGLKYIPTALITTIIGILFILPDILYVKTPTESLWKKWDACHTAKKQQDRIERALVYNELTPVKIDSNLRYAKFASQTSKDRYFTTLRSCTCPDFRKRKLPCKHMYYLAKHCNVHI